MMTLISTVTVTGADATSIEWTSIAGTFTDLFIEVSSRSDYGGATHDAVMVRFNSSTSGYTGRRLLGNGSGASSDSVAVNSASVGGLLCGNMPTINATSNTFGNSAIYIPNYAGSTNKSVSSDGVSENNATGSELAIHAGLWSNTAAITTVTLLTYYSSAKFKVGTTASIYGVTKGSGGATVSP